MYFGGIQKNSFIDFPGKISCVLFVSGCNFTCPYCHNPDLAKGKSPIRLSEDQVYHFLDQRRGFLEGVVLSGGEPTLYREIFPFLRRIKAMGYPVKLDTNGSRPRIIEQLLDQQLIDYVAMDVKTDPADYGPPLAPADSGPKVIESIKLLLTGRVPYEFRTTCVAPFISPTIMTRIGYWLKGARHYFLQPFRPDRVLKPDFFSHKTDGACDPEALRNIVAALVPNCRVRC